MASQDDDGFETVGEISNVDTAAGKGRTPPPMGPPPRRRGLVLLVALLIVVVVLLVLYLIAR
jgi:hypothetical protein